MNLTYFRAITEHFGLSGRSSLIYADGEKVFGVPLSQLATVAKNAPLFNISGHLTNPQIRQNVARTLYYDDDPGFTQFWHAAGKLHWISAGTIVISPSARTSERRNA